MSLSTLKDVWHRADHPLYIINPTTLNTPNTKQKLWANAYGSLEINANSQVHCKWDLAVQTTDEWSASGLTIGITSTLDSPSAFHTTTECINYCYQPYYSQVVSMNVVKKYGRKYIEPNPVWNAAIYNQTELGPPTATVIEKYRREQSDEKIIKKWVARDDIKSVSVELNLKTNHLSFWLNDVCQGVAYFVSNQKGVRYRLAVSSCNSEKQIIIKSFKQFKHYESVNNVVTNYYTGYLNKQSKYIGNYSYRWMMLKGDRKLYSSKCTYQPNDMVKCSEVFDLTVYDGVEREKGKFKIFSSKNPKKEYRIFYPKKCDISTMDDWVRMIRYVQQNKGGCMMMNNDEINSVVEEKENDEDAIIINDNIETMKEQIKVKTAVSLKCIAWNNEEVINWIFSIENGLFKQRYGDDLAKELKIA
eukprot:706981_1